MRVTGLLPMAENAVGGNSMRPGDVLTQYGGRTTEVTNTDAEGRLVLADGLAYAVDKLDPDVLVDIATLTGGIKVALGQHTGGLFANDDALAELLDASGDRAGEPVWRMPLSDEYEHKLSSKIADCRQRSRAARRRSRRRCSSSTSSAACPGPTSTSPRSGTPPRTGSSGPRGRPASAPGSCSTGSARHEPLAGVGASMSASALTVRWSLAGARDGIEQELRDYVAAELARPLRAAGGTALQDLADAGRRVVRGQLRLRRRCRPRGVPGVLQWPTTRPVTKIIGSRPVLIEECEVVAVAGGPEGFVSVPSYDAAG